MSNVITYDMWNFTFVCLRMYGQFPTQQDFLCRTIQPAGFYNQCLPLECIYHALTICHMQVHMTYGSLNYELVSAYRLIIILAFAFLKHLPFSKGNSFA